VGFGFRPYSYICGRGQRPEKEEEEEEGRVERAHERRVYDVQKVLVPVAPERRRRFLFLSTRSRGKLEASLGLRRLLSTTSRGKFRAYGVLLRSVLHTHLAYGVLCACAPTEEEEVRNVEEAHTRRAYGIRKVLFIGVRRRTWSVG
jgi:hypothetical protein